MRQVLSLAFARLFVGFVSFAGFTSGTSARLPQSGARNLPRRAPHLTKTVMTSVSLTNYQARIKLCIDFQHVKS
jgi:hypothetical protein